jgi:hypothetical protein
MCAVRSGSFTVRGVYQMKGSEFLSKTGSEFLSKTIGGEPEDFEAPSLKSKDDRVFPPPPWMDREEITAILEGDDSVIDVATKTVFYPKVTLMSGCFRPGCEGHVEVHGGGDSDTYISCSECSLETRLWPTEAEAIADWNDRGEFNPTVEVGYYLMTHPKAASTPVEIYYSTDSFHVLNHGSYEHMLEAGYTFQPLFLAPAEPVPEEVPGAVIEIMKSFLSSFPVKPETNKVILDWLERVSK